MLRAKSPFKKRSLKIDDNDPMSAPTRPLLHYSSVQEFQELQKHQQLLNGNAWAQQRSRTNSVAVDEPDTPKTTMADVLESIESASRKSFTIMDAKTPKSKKKGAPAPLKLIPDSATKASPTQRDSLEKKHIIMQAQLNTAAHDSHRDYSAKINGSTTTSPNASVEHISRPKSPGKRLFQKFFRHHTSSGTPPKISPEWEETPEKAAKILGKESIDRGKRNKASKKRASEEEKLLNKLDFKCAGDGLRSGSDTLASTLPSSASSINFDAPTDHEIRSVGGISRYATRIPTSYAQGRTVSDTVTIQSISNAIDSRYDRASDGYHLGRPHQHLQYINNAIPPTPPSKDSRRGMMSPSVAEVPPLNVKDVLSNSPETPNTAFRIVSKGEKPSPLPPHLAHYSGNEYLNLVLNKPSYSSLRGAPSVRSAYGFIISPSAELANGSSFASPVSHFIESPIIPRSAGLSKSRNASHESSSKGSSPQGGRALSRRWSDSSLAAWKVQQELAVRCLPPTFYSPYGFNAPSPSSGYRSFTRPSANEDPSLYYLPQTTAGDLESFASRTTSEGKLTPSTSAEKSSFACDKDDNVLDKDTTPIHIPRRFLVKKRSTSNIAAAARTHALHGLGLSPLISEAMHQVSNSSNGSEEISFPGGPPSAMPPPLNVFRSASTNSLPAKEELDAFLALHMHMDHNTNGIHHLIDHKFDECLQAMTSKHDDVLKALNTSFQEVLGKISGLDENYVKLNGNLDVFKNEMNDKMMDTVKLLQEKVLGPMGKMIETNAQLDKSVGHLIARIMELEKGQKEINEALKTKATQKPEQPATLPPVVPSVSPSHSTNLSPHHSYSSQNFAVSYPTSYGGSHPTSSYQYLPYVDPFTSGPPYGAPPGWSGQVVEANFAKMPREQRVQRMQTRYGGGIQMPVHPAYRNNNPNSGTDADFGKDGANGA